VGFDDTADECRSFSFTVPTAADSSGTVTFRLYSKARTAPGSPATARWDLRHNGGSGDNADPDQSATVESATETYSTTQDNLEKLEWTETMSNLGWAAEDYVRGMLCRDANHGTDDTLSGDADADTLDIEVPLA
jgi:hypothetical protein